jgi:hypothetical protein
MSFYPIAAISVSKMLSDHFAGENSGLDKNMSRAFKTLGAYSTVLIVVAVLFKVFEAPEGLEGLFTNLNVTFLLIGAAGLISSIIFMKVKNSKVPVIIMVATMLIVAVYTAACTMSSIEYFKPMKLISQRINSEYMAGQTIAGYNVLNKGSFQHYVDKPIIWVKDIFELRELMKKPDRIMLVTNEKDFLTFGKEFENQLFLVVNVGEMVLLSNQK